MTPSLRRLFQPWSFGLAITLTALTALAVVVIGIASILARPGEVFSLGVGLMLVLYGAIMFGIAWAAFRRHSWAWGLLVAAALLNAFAFGSFLDTNDTGQRVMAGVALAVTVATVISGILPSTRLAMQGEPEETA